MLACTQLKVEEVEHTIIPLLGGIGHLKLVLVPPNLFMGGPAGFPEDTDRMEALVRQVCISLEGPAFIRCSGPARRLRARRMCVRARGNLTTNSIDLNRRVTNP